jgi:hypothetical protein
MTDEPKAKVPVLTGGAIKSFVPQSLDEAWRLARAFHAGGIAPRSFKGPEGVLVAIIAGAAVGMDPIAAMSGIYIVGGRPQLFGDALLAVVRRSGKMTGFREWMEGQGETLTAWCEVEREGSEKLKRHFTWAMAKRAGLAGKEGPWTQYPARMLTMRARNFALRDLFADVLSGLSNDMPEPTEIGSITPHGDNSPPEPDHEDVIDAEVENSDADAKDQSSASPFPEESDHVPPDPDASPENARETPGSDTPAEEKSSEADELLGALDTQLKAAWTPEDIDITVSELDIFANLENDEDAQAAAQTIIDKHAKRVAKSAKERAAKL